MRNVSLLEKVRFRILTAIFVASVFSAANAQTATSISGPGIQGLPKDNRNFTQLLRLPVEGFLDSKLMGRKMPYRIILPQDYGNPGNAKRHPVVYLLHGLTGHYSNWTDKTKVAEYSSNSNFIIVTAEGDNGWYSDSVTKPNDKYESYIIQELIPEIDAKYRTIADREHRMIAGLSMGGYGAMKFGLKYPDKFALVGSFSGALGATGWNEKTAGAIAKTMDIAFGPELGSEVRNANDVFKLVRDATAEKQKTFPFIYLSCGTEDFLIANNRDFLAALVAKKVPHEYREHPGGHDWNFWDDQVREFLMVADRILKK